ncbi:hypothetical protein A6R68_24154, partial [Neotoma lepida]
PYLRALAAAAKLTRKARKITLFQPTMVYSTHCLSDLLSDSFLSLLGSSRVRVFHLLFLENLQITLAFSPAINPATLLPVPSSSNTPSHFCPEAVEALCSPRSGVLDQALTDPKLILFVDGSSLIDRLGNCQEAYAVVTSTKTVEVIHLSMGTSSQKAELIALTKVLQIAKPKALFHFLEPLFDPMHLQACILKVQSSCQTCAKVNPQGALQIP